jgi:hypothetical protein
MTKTVLDFLVFMFMVYVLFTYNFTVTLLPRGQGALGGCLLGVLIETLSIALEKLVGDVGFLQVKDHKQVRCKLGLEVGENVYHVYHGI